MANFVPFLDASQVMSITLASLANNAARESSAVSNVTSAYLDVHVQLSVATSGSAAGDRALLVYAYGTENGSRYTYNVTGVDAAVTVNSPVAFRLIGTIPHANSGTQIYVSQPMAVAPAFGGFLPRNWGLVVENRTGRTLLATSHEVRYTGQIVQG